MLGALTGSGISHLVACFSNHSILGQIEWPKTETRFSFGPHEIIAFPPSKEHDASLHIDLSRSQITNVEGMSVLNQVLSIAAWLDDTFAVLHSGWSGNPVPRRPDRQTTSYPTSILDGWCNSWGPIKDETARRAVAIYREAVNMYHFHSIPYAVLGFYKILETTFDGQQRQDFLEHELEKELSNGGIERFLLREIGFQCAPTPSELASFLRKDGRHAVAHASNDPSVNPDDIQHVRSMSVAAQILRPLARTFIKRELGVGTNRWDQADCGDDV